MTRSWRIPFTTKRIRWIVYESEAAPSYQGLAPETESRYPLKYVTAFANTAGRRLA